MIAYSARQAARRRRPYPAGHAQPKVIDLRSFMEYHLHGWQVQLCGRRGGADQRVRQAEAPQHLVFSGRCDRVQRHKQRGRIVWQVLRPQRGASCSTKPPFSPRRAQLERSLGPVMFDPTPRQTVFSNPVISILLAAFQFMARAQSQSQERPRTCSIRV